LTYVTLSAALLPRECDDLNGRDSGAVDELGALLFVVVVVVVVVVWCLWMGEVLEVEVEEPPPFR